ncbi:NAD(+) diphosphatase [Acetobacteraceae bacterium KSS8]|uniref:NAD(+) diphosphatase n=1 Tax=Endosaccharibacter trunci TaxID=2812733 RepID=A0ABT1W208_9PROT|nr:NAD(+) diphosphatase [Acetobacteraceae bacterium KSS8]
MAVTFFSGGAHDRGANDRENDARIEQYRRDPAARFIPLWRGLHAVRRDTPDEAPALFMPRRDAFPPDGLDTLPWTFLGTDESGPLFSVDLDEHDDPSGLLPPDTPVFEPLRPVAPLLPGEQPALAAQARGMHHWRRQNRFCGVCGKPLQAEHGGHRLQCASGHLHFPRTDPVVIMLVRHGDQALLARGVRFPPGLTLSALAGFIEPGESAEEAVAREVWEEVGLRVRDVRYLASQPWPFPGSLMLGFHAETDETALSIDANEITHARWVTRADVREADPAVFTIPDRTAIARLLIDEWLNE